MLKPMPNRLPCILGRVEVACREADRGAHLRLRQSLAWLSRRKEDHKKAQRFRPVQPLIPGPSPDREDAITPGRDTSQLI